MAGLASAFRPITITRASAFLMACIMLAGCQGGGGHAVAPLTTVGLPRGVTVAGGNISTPVSTTRGGALAVPLAGTITWGAGAIRGAGVLSARRVHIASPPPTIGGLPISRVGDGILVETKDATIAAPLTVTFPAAVAARSGAIVAVHLDDSGRWSLLPHATTRPGGGISVSTATFSIVTWAESKIFKPVGDFLANKVAGRTQPSVCAAAPTWVSVVGNPTGSTHSCVRTGNALADGTQIAELEIKSNRGTYQWVQLPSTLNREYVYVEDQPDIARALIDATFHDPSTILLAPGKRVTIGYRQPATPTQLRFHTYVDNRTAGLSLLRLALDAIVDTGVDSTGGWLAVLKCSKALDIDPTNLNNPVALHWPNLILAATRCIYNTATDFADHPKRAAEVAGELLGSNANPDDLTAVTTDLFKIGKYAKLIGTALNLGTYIVKEVSLITDALSAGIGITGSTDITLTLNARTTPRSSGAPLTRDAILSAPVPSVCGHPAGRLTNGELLGIPQDEGSVGLGDATYGGHHNTYIAIGDLDGDGIPEGVAIVNCSTGGNGVLSEAYAWRSGPTLIGRVPFDAQKLSATGTMAGVSSVAIDNEVLEVGGFAYKANDSHGGPSIVITRRYRLTSSGIFVATS